MREKLRVLEKEEEGMNLGGRESVKTYLNVKYDLICLYLLLGYSKPIVYSIFLYFIIL